MYKVYLRQDFRECSDLTHAHYICMCDEDGRILETIALREEARECEMNNPRLDVANKIIGEMQLVAYEQITSHAEQIVEAFSSCDYEDILERMGEIIEKIAEGIHSEIGFVPLDYSREIRAFTTFDRNNGGEQ